MVLTMVSFVLTRFRGKYIEYQLNMLYGKRVSVFGRVCAPPPTTHTSTSQFQSSRMPKYNSIEIIPNIKTMIFWNQLHATSNQKISKITLSIGCLLWSLIKTISNCITVILVPTWHDQWQIYLYIESTYTTVATYHSSAGILVHDQTFFLN